MSRGTRKDCIDTLAARYWATRSYHEKAVIESAMIRRFGHTRKDEALKKMRKINDLLTQPRKPRPCSLVQSNQ